MDSITFRSVIPTRFPPARESGIWGREIAVKRGDAILVTGASGSGKTSLLSFALGIRADFTGRILWGGRDSSLFRDGERSAVLMREIAAVYQDLKLIEGLSARENVEVKRRLAPFRGAAEAGAMAERLGIGRVFDDPVECLSRGEQQRAAILRALVQPFGFLFLDEPFSHLDAATAREARALIEEERAARGAALILLDLDDSAAAGVKRRIDL